MTAFVAGVNAYIASNGERLPVEFVLTGIKPEPWTVETLLLRQVTFGDATSELQLARQVASLGGGGSEPPAQARSLGRARRAEGARRGDHR